MKLWPWALGAGMAAGAVAIMVMPYNNPTRKFAAQTARKVENAVTEVAGKISNEISNYWKRSAFRAPFSYAISSLTSPSSTRREMLLMGFSKESMIASDTGSSMQR